MPIYWVWVIVMATISALLPSIVSYQLALWIGRGADLKERAARSKTGNSVILTLIAAISISPFLFPGNEEVQVRSVFLLVYFFLGLFTSFFGVIRAISKE